VENLDFRPHRDRRKKAFRGHFTNHRQPEIADETGNTYNAETITDSTEIPTKKSEVYDHAELEK